MNGAQILGIFLVILVVVVICSSIRVVPQAHAYVIERLGTYNTTWSAGLHLKTPLIDKVAHRISMKEQVVDFAPQPVITKDNVTMRIDTVVFFQITDPKLFAYGVEKPIMAIENLTATTLRNIIGELELDQTLTSRETINTKMRATLDEATDPWGIKVNRVELKNIIPPAAIQDAMETQMKKYHRCFTTAESEKKALKKKNDDLTEALEKSQQQSTVKKLQEARLQSDYERVKGILDRIPSEIIQAYTQRGSKKQEVNHYSGLE